ncbi:helix-turn-helix domain-containing protein [Pararhizobium antarcticum]|nr:helix-turn-helix domain-containing protein [Pararhizobium antarcticum]
MSKLATDWAILQRGLHPAAKLVLWHLSNRHTPGSGCFPSQDQLTADAEISRASLNIQLRRLEEAGLIRRLRRPGRGPTPWKSTRYILGFEADFPQKPSPDSGRKSGQKPSPDLAQTPGKPCPDLQQKHAKPCPDLEQSHLRILDTNLVRKKETTTARSTHAGTHDTHAREAPEMACLAACGEGLCVEARAVIQATAPVIDGWMAAGYDLDADILPVLQARTLRKRDDPIRTWAYFTPAVAKRHAQRVALTAKPKSAGETQTAPTLSAQEILLQTAQWLNSGRFVPPSAVNNTTRDALLRAGLVTKETLRSHQIY